MSEYQDQLTIHTQSWPSGRIFLLVGGAVCLAITFFLYSALQPNEILFAFLVLLLSIVAFGIVGVWHHKWLNGLGRWAQRVSGLTAAQLTLLYLALPLGIVAKLLSGEELLARYWYLSLFCWLIAIAFVWWSGRELQPAVPSTQQAHENARLFTRTDMLSVAGLLVAALFVRATFLDLYPTTISGDEGSSGLAAVEYGTNTANNLFITGWFSFPSFYFAVQNIGIEIWGQTVQGLRIMSAIAGALTVVALYGAARVMFDRTTAVVAALLLTSAHHHIHFSRIGLNNIWDGLFVSLVLMMLWQGWQSGRRQAYVLCGLILGLSQYFYGSMRILPVVILIWAGFAWLVQGEKFKQQFPNFVLTAYASLIVFLPLALFFWNHPDVFRAPLSRVSIFGGWLEREAVLLNTSMLDVYLNQLSLSAQGIFLEPLRMWYTPNMAMLFPIEAILFLGGIFLVFRRPSLAKTLIFLVLIGNILTMSLTNDVPAAQRYMLAPPMVMMFIALSLTSLMEALRARLDGHQYAPLFVTLIATVMLMALNLNFYFFQVYEDFTLGGINTEVATKIALRLQPEDDPNLTVHFAGAPRMFYTSHSTIPFLVSDATGIDIEEPLTAAPEEPLAGENIFVFLPERQDDLTYVQQSYPNGQVEEFFNEKNELLFLLYTVQK